MFKTPKEAQRMICPFMSGPVRIIYRDDGEIDEDFVMHAGCRSSECMAWREGKLPKPKTITHQMAAGQMKEIVEKDLPDPERPEGVPESYNFMIWHDAAFWQEGDASLNKRRPGYCALIGQPKLQEGMA
jgi:hypothetical protein